MNEVGSLKITFYNLNEKKYNLTKINDFLLDNKEVKVLGEFNNALKRVTQKDINKIASNVNNMVREIKKRLLLNGFSYEKELSSDLKNIDSIISCVEEIISNLIVQKNSVKVGIFSINKKEKKDKIKSYEKLIDYLLKCQNNLISVKDEYNKLNKRKDSIKQTNEKDEVKKEDPLERTINFYMKQGD